MRSSKTTLCNIALNCSSTKFIKRTIDDLIETKNSAGSSDYSYAVAKMFIAKSVIDEKQVVENMMYELLSAINSHSKDDNTINLGDLSLLINDITSPMFSQLEERLDEIESEMDWIELAKYKQLCGE